ncbi:MAG: hypothetical protein JNM63_05040 [Spirochaetia bacterium]|nr:hypothetical protein [Spirochaetia bacterium]
MSTRNQKPYLSAGEVDALLRSVPLEKLSFRKSVIREEKTALRTRKIFLGGGSLLLAFFFAGSVLLHKKNGPGFLSPDQVDAYVSSLTADMSSSGIYASETEDVSNVENSGE